MRIVIFGVGGVGGYFGGRLAQAGQEAIFIARGPHLQAMREYGLHVESIKGDFIVEPIQATDNPVEVGPVDAILLGVKAWQVTEAAEAIRPMIGADTFVIPLQNGVEAPARLAKVIGHPQVLGGFCRIVSYVTSPGKLRQTGGDPFIAFGELDNRRSQRAERLLNAFAQTVGVTAEIPLDIQAAMWSKFLLISSWSGMGAVTRAPVGVWRSLPGTRDVWQRAMREVLALAEGRNIALTEEIIHKATAYVDGLPSGSTASMQRDIMDSRPSELDTLSGGVVRLGQETGLDTSVHSFIYHALLPLEKKARGEIDFSL